MTVRLHHDLPVIQMLFFLCFSSRPLFPTKFVFKRYVVYQVDLRQFQGIYYKGMIFSKNLVEESGICICGIYLKGTYYFRHLQYECPFLCRGHRGSVSRILLSKEARVFTATIFHQPGNHSRSNSLVALISIFMIEFFHPSRTEVFVGAHSSMVCLG